MRETGIIKFFGKNRRNQKINFGFIKRDNGNEVYIHKDNTCYTLAELAERLGVEDSIIESEKLKPSLSAWTISKDPKSIEWEYLSETNNFYPVSLPEGMRVTFEVITNTEKGKDEAKSLHILLKQHSVIENSGSQDNTSISTNSINDIDLNLLDYYLSPKTNIKVKFRENFTHFSHDLQLIKRINSVDFIYCLYLEKNDAIYWGMTSNLTQRMQQHYQGKVTSTRQEAVQGKIWILYTLPFRNREDAEKVEEQAWNKSGGGILTNNDYSRSRQTFLEVEYAGTVARMDFAYRHLINLGWTGTKIKLKDFLENTSKYLHLWDEIGNNINYDILAEIFDIEQIKKKTRNHSNRIKYENSGTTPDIRTVKRLSKNEVKYLVEYYAELNDNKQEVICGVIVTPAIITDYNNTLKKSILHLEAYETKEEAQKALNNVDYQIPNIYLYLLDNGWNGRRFNIELFLSASCQVNNIQRRYSNYSHNEKLKILRKYIIANHQDEQSYKIANLGKRFSTSANISWRTLLFPQDWIDIYKDNELQQQAANSSDSTNRIRLRREEYRLEALANLKALSIENSNTSKTSNISDKSVAESDETEWIDWGNMTV